LCVPYFLPTFGVLFADDFIGATVVYWFQKESYERRAGAVAVVRTIKKGNYTVVDNHYLRDMELSSKAVGVLTKMLMLPENWNFTVRGLAAICKEGVYAIRTAIQELEARGYLVRRCIRENGRFADTEYIVYEIPQTENEPSANNSYTEESSAEEPFTENRAQLNKDKSTTKKENKEKLSKDSFPSIPVSQRSVMKEEKRSDRTANYYFFRERIRENISYDELCNENVGNTELIDGICELAAETLCGERDTIRIGSTKYPAEMVRERFLKLNADHIRFLLECMSRNTTEIRNIRQYLLASMFNAPTTIESYYAAKVNHELNDSQYEDGAAVYGSEWERFLA